MHDAGTRYTENPLGRRGGPDDVGDAAAGWPVVDEGPTLAEIGGDEDALRCRRQNAFTAQVRGIGDQLEEVRWLRVEIDVYTLSLHFFPVGVA